MTDKVRAFESGATRDKEEGKLDYEGFLSFPALQRYALYMDSHRLQQDGKLRDSDNWQKGMPLNVYMKSMWRHLLSAWAIHRGFSIKDERDGHLVTIDEALCGLLFNVFGYLHEILDVRKIEED